MRVGSCKSDAYVRADFGFAGSNFEEPQAQGRKLGDDEHSGLGDGFSDASHRPVYGGVRDHRGKLRRHGKPLPMIGSPVFA